VARLGGLGHASHQNGLDVDVLYPRSDLQELAASKPAQIDRPLAQALLDDFLAAGAQYIFVGPHTHLTGPRRTVQPLAYHDDHMHVRFFARGKRSG
jgi:murein endopeptidase